ncbi:hypothetical protein [Brucella pseudogrignonensis]|uniref:hypothetical protein n=1 Tax=Brucella pseudogrignonensis TaxID=419475 RepID=UPI0038D1C683
MSLTSSNGWGDPDRAVAFLLEPTRESLTAQAPPRRALSPDDCTVKQPDPA